MEYDKHDEYLTLNEEYQKDLTFKEFFDLWYKTNPRGGFHNHNQNYEIKNVIWSISFPYIDGSSKCTTSSWVQKLDTYFQLNPMDERVPRWPLYTWMENKMTSGFIGWRPLDMIMWPIMMNSQESWLIDSKEETWKCIS